MAALESQVLKEGFLDVKVPRGDLDRKLMKAWRRMWVSAMALFPVGRGEPHLILNLSKKAEESPVKKVKTPRDVLHLFRCRSSTRSFSTWALSSGNTLQLYLAAETELQAQQWMQITRDGLWPPLSPFEILTDSYDVSLIDDEKTFSAGLLGIYGRLTLTSGDTISVLHSHWGGVLLRLPLADIREVNLVRTAGNENPEAGVFSVLLCSKENTGLRTLQFYSFSAIEAVEWLRSLSKIKDPKENPRSAEVNETSSTDPTSGPVPSSDFTCEYAVVNKNRVNKTQQNQKIPSINVEESTYGQINQSKGVVNRLGNIPGDFLNASISSIRPCRADTDESSSSNEDENAKQAPWVVDDTDWFTENVYEHIYEELESRRGTIYEELDPVESEYIPPLPPVISNSSRTQKEDPNLRLLKLSYSVTEALKLAETTTPSKLVYRNSLKKNNVERCKSDQSILVQGGTSSPASDGSEPDAAPMRKRTLSVPDISDSLLYVNTLPLVAFNSKADKKQPLPQTSGNVVETKQPSLMDLLQSLNPRNINKSHGPPEVASPANSFARRKSSGQYMDMRPKK